MRIFKFMEISTLLHCLSWGSLRYLDGRSRAPYSSGHAAGPHALNGFPTKFMHYFVGNMFKPIFGFNKGDGLLPLWVFKAPTSVSISLPL